MGGDGAACGERSQREGEREGASGSVSRWLAFGASLAVARLSERASTPVAQALVSGVTPAPGNPATPLRPAAWTLVLLGQRASGVVERLVAVEDLAAGQPDRRHVAHAAPRRERRRLVEAGGDRASGPRP